jgi:hypothetical protein
MNNALTRRARCLRALALVVCVLPACGDEVFHVSAASRTDARLDARATGAADAASTSDAASDDASATDAPPATDTGAPDVEAGVNDAAPESGGVPGICANAPSGTKVLDVPADCHATICDGAGHAAGAVVAQSNLPAAGPCLVGTCDALGRAGTAPLPADTACTSAGGGAVCDGAGSCVECNHTNDCAPGLYCDVTHHCGTVPCTDLDCGGACPPCGLGKRCSVDGDCLSYACDASSATCIQNQCLDHVQDGNETGVDCGGGLCAGCELGQACLLDQDCRSQACDTVTLQCITNQCIDHRTDGEETDVDCGGGLCPACGGGQACKTNLDCQAGHVCLGQKKACS